VSTGIFNLMVPIKDRRALSRINADPRALFSALGGVDVVAYCFALGNRGQAFARGMLPWSSYEDPGTGSAAGSLGAYLVRHGKLSVGEPLAIAQGIEMERPCRIGVAVEERRGKLTPRVSGASVVVFEGQLEA
jgi:trans-2,3-dihydro-3-hydroxyanthranilate isomerase